MASKKLVLVESPAKAKTIQKFVKKGMIVKATFGHIRDLPKSTLGVDVDDNFEPKYVIPKKAAAVVKELKAAAKSADEVYLATDPDREGEAIAWHVTEALDLKKDKVHRILFHEITQTAIQHAIDNPGKIKDNLVDAQQARRVLDRLVGYGISPWLWQKLYRGLSAGRVQSAALRLIVDRDTEIAAFKPTEYWSLWATFTTAKKESFLAKLEKVKGKPLGKYPDKTVIEAAEKASATKDWVITDRVTEQKVRNPKPPFTTSTLQQESGRKLRFSVKQTMAVAQKLYEGIAISGEPVGLITYMRTDSLSLAETAVTEARKIIASEFGETYVPKEVRKYKTKSKGAQEAHEAIRPTSFARTPESVKKHLSDQEFKLYKLIWERAIASQMASAQIEALHLHVGPAKEPQSLSFVAHGQRILFAGYLKVYEEGRDDPKDDSEEKESSDEQILPNVDKNDPVSLDQIEPKQHFTQPPPRFTEASLVKEMESLGIGRPSTYSPTISTLIERNYVRKEEGKFFPQEVGVLVTNLLKEKFPEIVDYDFTAQMEEKLDSVAEGEQDWHKLLADFYTPFNKTLESVKKDKDGKSLVPEETGEVCPTCGKPLLMKMSRFGKFFACSGFPECRYTRPADVDEAQVKEEEKLIDGRKCPDDGGELIIRRGRFGSFIGCANYPKCRHIESIDKDLGIACPKDGGKVVERRSKRGKLFWGCANYPKCDFVAWDKPLPEPCPTCKGILVQKKKEIVCLNGDYSRAVVETEGAHEAIPA